MKRIFSLLGLVFILSASGCQEPLTDSTGGSNESTGASGADAETDNSTNQNSSESGTLGASSTADENDAVIPVSEADFRIAAQQGAVEIVREGLRQNVDVNRPDKDGNTALLGALLGNHVEIRDLLLDSGAKVDEQVFRVAADKGVLRIVELGIEEKLDINSADPDGRTALMYAAFMNRVEIAKMLLTAGADVKLRDSANRAALTFASMGPTDKIARMLIEAGADVNITDKPEGFTPLMWAAAEGQFEVCKLLLENGADKSIADIDGDTALSFAKQKGNAAIVKLLEGE